VVMIRLMLITPSAMKVLIDADILTYKLGFALEGEPKFFVKSNLDKYIRAIIEDSGCKEYQLYLTGKNNYRNTVTDTYKANRKDSPKPKYYAKLRELMVRDWGAEVIDGMEADDKLGLEQTEHTMIASIDKDLLIVSGWHFNLNSREKKLVTDEEGDRFFYKQMLMGDNVDNIKAIKGIGTKTADKLLDAINRSEWDAMIMDKYEEHFGGGWYQRFVENAMLLWILNKREMPIEIRGEE
jgi:5'-3' exonuclease